MANQITREDKYFNTQRNEEREISTLELYQINLDIDKNELKIYGAGEGNSDLNCNEEAQKNTVNGIRPSDGVGICNAGDYPY
jgi:hypothetical protein